VRLRLRLVVLALLAVLIAAGGVLLSGGFGVVVAPVATTTAGPSADPGASPGETPVEPTIAPTPTPRPAVGGTELYGYLPYWQMSGTMATHLRSTPLSTVALFSVSARRNGALNTTTTGYRRITGSIGRQLIDEARDRGTRVDLVFTSFGADRNAIFFGRVVPASAASSADPGASAGAGASGATPLPASTAAPTPGPTAEVAPWHRTVDELVALAVKLGVDGLSVDVELLDPDDRPAYGEFLAALRKAFVAVEPDATLTVATEAGLRGTGNAATAIAAGVDRLFLMGYDYHWSGSQPGASSPIDRNDGLYTLRWSIDQYVEAGVPRDRILLGLPLYGMRWRLESPSRTARVIGKGVTWVPNQHLDLLLDPDFHPGRDLLEFTHVVWEQDGGEWIVTYYDSPATLRPKLALAIDNGLAGSGFWAMGYERGLPGYLRLMTDFRTGAIDRSEAPPRPEPTATPTASPMTSPTASPSP
jgi:hypothetical protein